MYMHSVRRFGHITEKSVEVVAGLPGDTSAAGQAPVGPCLEPPPPPRPVPWFWVPGSCLRCDRIRIGRGPVVVPPGVATAVGAMYNRLPTAPRIRDTHSCGWMFECDSESRSTPLCNGWAAGNWYRPSSIE